MGDLEVTAHLKIRLGQLEAFKTQVAEILRLTRREGHADASLRLVHQHRSARSARSTRRIGAKKG